MLRALILAMTILVFPSGTAFADGKVDSGGNADVGRALTEGMVRSIYLSKFKVAAPSLLVVSASSGAMAESKFTIGKETTYVTSPLDTKGNVDYEIALNERLGKDITPQNNANVLLWSALQPQPKRFPMPPEFFRWLKVPAPDRGGDFRKLDTSNALYNASAKQAVDAVHN